MSVKSLSVFFPAYNEEGNIKVTVEKAIAVLKKLDIKYEVLIINDGSEDDTGKVADTLVEKLENVKVIHQKNGGYGMALRAGFENCKYPWVVYTDSDGQFDFREVEKFLEKTDDYDVIWGYRIKRSDPFMRLVFAKGWALSIFLFFGVWLKDIDCGFKMIKKDVLKKIPLLQSTRGGMINAELVIKAKKCGFKLTQVGVNHYPRKFGNPTGASIKVIIQSYVDLLKFRLTT